MEKTEIKGFTKETIGIICNKLVKISIEYEKLKVENKALKKQLTLYGVSQHRELLIAYCEHILDECREDDKEVIDEFLDSYSN